MVIFQIIYRTFILIQRKSIFNHHTPTPTGCFFVCNYTMSPQSILTSAIVYFCPVGQVCLEHFVLATFGFHLSTSLWIEQHAQIRLQSSQEYRRGFLHPDILWLILLLVFSGGQRRRVSLGAALLQNPELLILDEPTVGVDPVLRSKYVSLSHTAGLTVVHSPWPISFPRTLFKTEATCLDKRKSQITHTGKLQ